MFADIVQNTLNPKESPQKITDIVNKWISRNYDLNITIGSIIDEWVAKKCNTPI